jgi:hypothetical protein
MQEQPWRLGHDLGHLLGNLTTCGSRRLPLVLLLRVGGSMMNRYEWVTILGA